MSKNPTEKLNIFALAANGKSHSFEVSVIPDMNFVEESDAILLKHGFTVDELDNVILSPTELEKIPPGTAEVARVTIPSVELLESSDYPPIPKPKNKDDYPPQQSSEKLVSTHDIRLFIWIKTKHGRKYLPVESYRKHLLPPFPVQPKIVHKLYWMNTGIDKLIGPQHFSKAITTKRGMSKTNSATLSAQLGVAAKMLSAKLSQTLSSSITITEEESVTESYSIEVKDGSTVIYTLWQLIEKFALVDNAGNPIEWKGRFAIPGLAIPAHLGENVYINRRNQYASDPVEFT
jgi:hypothetical protein